MRESEGPGMSYLCEGFFSNNLISILNRGLAWTDKLQVAKAPGLPEVCHLSSGPHFPQLLQPHLVGSWFLLSLSVFFVLLGRLRAQGPPSTLLVLALASRETANLGSEAT